METLKGINAALTFFLELGMLAALTFFGFTINQPTAAQWLLGLGLPLLVTVLWSLFAAPRANHRLGPVWIELFRLVLFELAALAVYLTGNVSLAITFAAVALANQALSFAWKQ